MFLLVIALLLPMSVAAQEVEAYVVIDNGTMTFYYDNLRETRNGNRYIIDLEDPYGRLPNWYYSVKDVKKAVFQESFSQVRPKSTASWFDNCKNLSEIVGLEYLNTSEVKDMSQMFCYCSNLTALDLSTFDTGSVVRMGYLFVECTSLESLNISNWNTSNVEDMEGMFGACKKLKSLDLSHFDTHNVKDMEGLFYGCEELPILNLTSFDTQNVTTMRGMFNDCKKLSILDLSSFDTSKVTEMVFMFSGCNSLTTIYVGQGWSTQNLIAQRTTMFSDDTNLVGGMGTQYDESHYASDYAHVDGGPDNPGYFTYAFLLKPEYFADEAFYQYVFDKFGPSIDTKEIAETKDMNVAGLGIKSLQGIEFFTELETLNFSNNEVSYANLSSNKKLTAVNSTLNMLYGQSMEFFVSGLPTTENGKLYAVSLANGERNKMTSTLVDAAKAKGWTVYAVNADGSLVEYLGYDAEDPGRPYAVFSGGTLSFFCDNEISRPGTWYSIDAVNEYGLPMWISKDIKIVNFVSSFAKARPTSTRYWFSTCKNLGSIIGLEYLNTSEVTDMTCMFFGCQALTDLDLSTFDTGNVEDMSAMFSSCKNLNTINVSGWKTDKVKSMQNMFNYCSSLESLDLSSFDTSKVTDMGSMFNNCSSLTTIYCGNGWNTGKVTASSGMFNDCTKLVGDAGTKYDSSHTDKAYAHADGGTGNPGYLTMVPPPPYAVYNDGTLTFYYDYEGDYRTGTVYELNTGTEKPGWLTDETCYDVTTVVFDPSFANYTPATTAYWFNNMESLTEIKGMKDYLNTAHVRYMNDMFNGCRSMEVLDLSAFKTHNVNSMANMFANCTSLTTILVGNEWNVSGVIHSTGMFTNCRKLVGMAGTTYDKNNTDKAYAHPDGGEANPGYLSMKMMYVAVEGQTMKFYYDGNFYTRTEPVYDVDNLWTASTNEHAFDQVVIAEFDPSFADARPTSTAGWFYGLPKLSTFKGMRQYLNTSEVRTMRAMFNYLLYVEKLDLSGFDTHNVQDMTAMFSSSSYLETIWVGDGWNTDNVIESTGMFSSCRKLVGGEGTKYNEGHTDVSYAHVDGGTSNPGYLTKARLGDVNGDGNVNSADVQKVYALMAQSATSLEHPEGDVNDDGNINSADIQKIYAIMASL